MRGNAKDFLYEQVSSAISMLQGAKTIPGYWCSFENAQKQVEKLNWLLSESIGVPVQILTDASIPTQTYQIKVADEIVAVTATFGFIEMEAKSDASYVLHDVLTSPFPRITLNNLEGFDDVYQEFISNWVAYRREAALRAAGF